MPAKPVLFHFEIDNNFTNLISIQMFRPMAMGMNSSQVSPYEGVMTIIIMISIEGSNAASSSMLMYFYFNECKILTIQFHLHSIYLGRFYRINIYFNMDTDPNYEYIYLWI